MDSRIREELIREAMRYPKEAMDYLWHRANSIGEVNTLEALEYIGRLERALLDAPVASDARELAKQCGVVPRVDPPESYESAISRAAAIIESFAADRERKAREEMTARHKEYEQSVNRRWAEALAKHEAEIAAAREETARKCAEAAVAWHKLVYPGDAYALGEMLYRVIMEAAHE